MKNNLTRQNENRKLTKVELLELEISISHYFLNNPLKMLKHSLDNLGRACAKNNEMGITDIEKKTHYLKLTDSTFEYAYRFFCLNKSGNNNSINYSRKNRKSWKLSIKPN